MTGDTGAAPVQAARPSQARLAALGLAILLLVSLAARLWYSSASPLSYDETHNLMIGMLANQGYAPYREIYSVIMPFSVVTMQVSAALWGATQHVRTLMLLYGLMGVAALYFLVYRHALRIPVLAALFAATFFAFNPHFFFVSTSINLEAGALAWGLLSVALVELFHAGGDRRWNTLWLLLSGVAFGLSTTIKIFVPLVPAIVALQLLLILVADQSCSPRRLDTYWRLFRLGLIWAAGVLAALLFFVLLFDRTALVEQVLTSRFALREAIDTDDEVNIAEALNAPDLLQYAPLLLGSVAGVVALWRQRLVQAWIWPAWLLLAAAFLLTHDPVRPRHTVMALPPLAALSGIGLAFLLALLDRRNPQVARWLNPLLASGILLLTVLGPLATVETESFVERHPARQAAVDFVQQNTAPGDCLISKENRLHFLAGRLSTPHLSLISTARLFSGLLPAAAIAEEADTRDCPVLVYADTFDQLIPDLRQQLDNVYSLRLTLVDPREPDYRLDVYTVQLDNERAPEHGMELLLGDQIAFAGYNLTPGEWRPGEIIYLTTFWQAQAPMHADYKLFVHLLDEQGNSVANYDRYPFALDATLPVVAVKLNPAYTGSQEPLPAHYPATGMIPTSRWLPGKTLAETIALPLPADLAPGAYSLSLGMYDEQSMRRLPVSGFGLESDQVILEPVLVE